VLYQGAASAVPQLTLPWPALAAEVRFLHSQIQLAAASELMLVMSAVAKETETADLAGFGACPWSGVSTKVLFLNSTVPGAQSVRNDCKPPSW
jgi:hypothetical protein